MERKDRNKSILEAIFFLKKDTKKSWWRESKYSDFPLSVSSCSFFKIPFRCRRQLHFLEEEEEEVGKPKEAKNKGIY